VETLVTVTKGTDRLVIEIHDGAGGPGSYQVADVLGPVVFSVYLADPGELSPAVTSLIGQLRSIPGVTRVSYQSKADALVAAEASGLQLSQAIAILGENPLPASLALTTRSIAAIPRVIALVRAEPPGVIDNGSIGVSPYGADKQGIAEVALFSGSSQPQAPATPVYIAASGTVFLSADGRSGSVDAVLNGAGAATRVHATGTFSC
jgi:hypothetical protein